MTQLFANNAYTVLADNAAPGDGVIEVADGSKFPTPTGSEFFLLTLVGVDGNGNENVWEIVKCTQRTGNILTVDRAQEGTLAGSWPVATKVELRLTAGALDRLSSISVVALQGNTRPYIYETVVYTITNYNAFATYSVSSTGGYIALSGDEITFTAPSNDQVITLTVLVDGTPSDFDIYVQPGGVNTPSILNPSFGQQNQSLPVTLQASAFTVDGPADTHVSTDWQVSKSSSFAVLEVNISGDTVNKTSLELDHTDLEYDQEYYFRLRYTGASYGNSEWSVASKFTTEEEPTDGLIGVAGTQGFGVGTYPDTLPNGFTTLVGTNDPASPNYGNYQYSDGSILVFIPKFFYRYGSSSSPNYTNYGNNAIDIVGIDTYADEAEANLAGFAMHRAFIDGGAEKHGFFIDKYLASPDGNGKCKSVKNGIPISLTTSADYTKSSDLGGDGALYDAVKLSRGRGSGFNNSSVFMYSALALLSLAHGQAAANDTYCAWFDGDGITNYPKGCNDNSLGDVDDPLILYESAGDTGDASKPKTGSANNLAKTSHNGQDNGVVDLNGCMYQVALGITNTGSTATSTSSISNGDAYILKTSVALKDLTEGWSSSASGNEAWGTSTHLNTLYDKETGLFPWGSSTGQVYFGNSSNAVFSEDLSGQGWLRTACGIQKNNDSISAQGTNQFGQDGCYQYNVDNLYVTCSGGWNLTSLAGLFCRYWIYSRSYSNAHRGFRSAYYGG